MLRDVPFHCAVGWYSHPVHCSVACLPFFPLSASVVRLAFFETDKSFSFSVFISWIVATYYCKPLIYFVKVCTDLYLLLKYEKSNQVDISFFAWAFMIKKARETLSNICCVLHSDFFLGIVATCFDNINAQSSLYDFDELVFCFLSSLTNCITLSV